MAGREPERIRPWYRGFTGKIEETERSEKHFVNKGVVRIINDTTIEITELPIEVWTSDYKIYLEALIVGSTSSPSPKAAKAEAEGKAKVDKKSAPVAKQVIQSFKEYHTDATVRFEIKMKADDVEYYRTHMEELEDYLKLTGRIQYTNMTMYDPKGHLKKYESTEDVLKEFYLVRLAFYTKRRTYQMKVLRRLLNICEAKVRFIEEIIAKTLDIMYKENDAVIALLEERGYPKFSTEDKDLAHEGAHEDQDYEYLLTMHIRSLTKTRLDQLRKEHEEKLARFKELEAKDEIQLWKDDLAEFKVKYAEMIAEYEERYEAERNAVVAPTGAVKKKRAVTVKKGSA